MSDFEPGFALGGPAGPDAFVEGATLPQAVREAENYYPKHTRVMFDGDLLTAEAEQDRDEYVPNLAPQSMPELAHLACGLGTYGADEVMALTVADAHARLRPFFRHYSEDGKPGQLVAAYARPLQMVRRFLTANAKLVKGARGKKRVKPGLSRGPTLLPHRLTAELSPTKRLVVSRRTLNFCVGSSPGCRESCLLYSGQNPMADGQTPVKLSRSESLITDPVAWLRMFVAAIEWHVEWCRNPGSRTRYDVEALFGAMPAWKAEDHKSAKTKFVPYVRPNVLSDIPFELVFPDLFGLFPNVLFYDYTKVPGRTIDRNYDITFSWSGTKSNRAFSEFEMARGRRLAVVFWLQKGLKVTDLSFMGRPVLDGDEHDFRPLDPPGSIIGLKYKTVRVVGDERVARDDPSSDMRGAPKRGSEKFVVPAYRDKETGALLVDGTPSQLGASMVFGDAGPTELA
jgi:hypothetical protein